MGLYFVFTKEREREFIPFHSIPDTRIHNHIALMNVCKYAHQSSHFWCSDFGTLVLSHKIFCPTNCNYPIHMVQCMCCCAFRITIFFFRFSCYCHFTWFVIFLSFITHKSSSHKLLNHTRCDCTFDP